MFGDNVDIPRMFQTMSVVPKILPGQSFDAISTGCFADFPADRDSDARAICKAGQIDENEVAILNFPPRPGQPDKFGAG